MQSAKYAANPRMSQSKLRNIFDGVEAFKDALENPMEQTAPMKIGSAVHMLLLEPARNAIAVLPKIDGSTREGKILKRLKNGHDLLQFPVSTKRKKEQGPMFYEVTPEEAVFAEGMVRSYGHYFKSPENYLFLNEEELKTAQAMVDSVRSNTDAMRLLNDCIAYEYEEEYSHKGIDLKCCYDGLGFDFVLDLKSTIIAPKYFVRKNLIDHLKSKIREMFYHFQAASYLKASKRDKYFIIFVRNEHPYQVFPRQLSEDLIAEGSELFDEACDALFDCFQTNPTFIADNRLELL